jgi:hypothetical protein
MLLVSSRPNLWRVTGYINTMHNSNPSGVPKAPGSVLAALNLLVCLSVRTDP